MIFAWPWLLLLFCALTGFAAGQSPDQNLPSAPFGDGQENAPAKQSPTNESSLLIRSSTRRIQLGIKARRFHQASSAPQSDSTKQNVPAATTSTTPAVHSLHLLRPRLS